MPYVKLNHDDINPALEALDLPEAPRAWLDVCYTALQCRSIQVVPTVLRGVVLVIDEEGKLLDGWQNRINKVASLLYGSDWDPIVGDAILARVNGEDLSPLTISDLALLRRYFC